MWVELTQDFQQLVNAARANNHEVICIPGPCAATTALVISGLPTKRFCFVFVCNKILKDLLNCPSN